MYLLYFTIFMGTFTFLTAWLVQVDTHVGECFYEQAQKSAKVGLTFQVVDGGFLDIDLTIHGPDNHEIYLGSRETSGKYSFTAYQEGIYTFCFSNEMSTVTPKQVMFDVVVGPITEEGTDNNTVLDQSITLQGMVTELKDSLWGISHEQDYLLIRANLHHKVSEQTNQLVGRWAVFQVLLIATGIAFEVWYLKRFFEIRRIL